MSYSTWMLSVVELVVSVGQVELRTRLKRLSAGVLDLIVELTAQPVTPATWFAFEQKLAVLFCEIGRELTEWVANGLKEEDANHL